MPAVAMTDHGDAVRCDRVLPAGEEGGDQADHRLRDVHGAGLAQGSKAIQRPGCSLSFHPAGDG